MAGYIEIADKALAKVPSAPVAVGAVTSPWWMNIFEGLSWFATMALPIGGLILVGMKIWQKRRELKRERDMDDSGPDPV